MATLGKNQVFEIKNGDGTSFHNLVLRKSAVESIVMSLGDKISGDVYYKDNSLSVTMHEYITYNGVNYMLVNPPTIVREGIVSDNSELKGMTKYSFVFYHPMYQLSNFPFTDVAVTSDETRYLSEGKTFSWIGKPADFVAKLNKNLTGTEWIVELSSRFPQDKLDELSNVIPFDNATIADACKTFYDTWGVPYVVDKVASTEASYAAGKRFKLVMGLPSNEIYENASAEQQNTPFVFQMGHGVGLKNNSRTPRNNKIITRISGYGSENNIPYGYPQVRWYGTAGQSFTYGDHAGVYTNVTIGGVHFDKVVSYPIYKGILNGEYVELIKHPFTRTHLMPSVYRTTLFNKISFYDAAGEANTGYDPDITLVDYYDAVYSAQYPYPNTINLQAPSYESHEFEDEKPELGEAHIISATPLNNDLTPASSWDDSLDDEGNYKQSYFQMVLPQLSFDLYACASITEEMQINMRSGACLGCTFTVQVDWDDYKRNFYDDEGNFAPNGSQRDLTKYPKSNQGSISLILQKDNSTFGTLMPNMYQYPKGETSSGAGDGDTFVILGISLPESYIFAAEWRLDADMKSYMLENNVHYFDYPLKFDEDFLFHNENILSQIRPNTVVRFNYAGQTQALFVKQITVKYGDQPLPQYDITLTDNVEVVLNQIGQVAEDVEKLSTLIAILRQSYGKNVWNELAKKLSKTQDDTAAGYITMLKGLQIGANFVPDILGEGGVLRMRDDGKVELVTDILYARMKAYFDSVEIREYQHTGGNRIASVAGNKICRVAWFNSSNVELEQTQANLSSVAYFRCYFRASDGEDTVKNNWIVGDLAYCHVTSIVNSSDNPEQKGLNQKHLWRLVVGRNTEGTLTEDGEAYIDLSNRATETISGNSYAGYQSGSDIPEAQDDIIQLGNVNDTTRQGAIVEFVTGTDAPSYQIYQGINSFSLNGKNQIGFGYNTGTGRAYLNVYGDAYIGARDRSTFFEYKQSGTGGNPELNIKAHVEFTNSNQELDTLVQSHQRDDSYDDTEVRGLIDGLQDQIDGQVESWFYNYAPVHVDEHGAPDSSVPLNIAPYSDWTTEADKIAHLGDTFTDNSTGYCWRFSRNSTTNAFEWVIIEDSAVITALQNAARAQDTADGKRRVFLTQPTPPYDAGDMWVNAVYPANYTGVTDEANHNYNNDILKCVTAKASDGSFSINDWALASKYTDDSKFNGYISALLNNTGLSGDSAAAAVQNAILGALGVGTVVAGGLLLTSLIGMRQYNGSGDKSDVSNYTTWAGISGQYNANVLGGGMAAWYGGGMVDHEVNTTATDFAKSLFRFDGSGYLAGGNITWNSQGAITIKNITTLSDSNNKNLLNELATFNSAFTFSTTGEGSTTVLSITPQQPFTELYIGTSKADDNIAATHGWVNKNFVTKTFFDNIFRLYNGTTKVNVNDTIPLSNNLNIEAMFGFWTKKYISALGQGDDGSTSYTTLAQLNDVTLTNPTANQILVYDGTHWRNQNQQSVYELPVATTTTLGGIMLGYAASGKNYAIQLDANGKAYVNVPWSDTTYTLPTASADTLGGVKVGTTLAISSGVLNLPTTGVTAGTYKRVTVDAYGRVTSGDNTDTDTWRGVYVDGVSKVGTGVNTKAINFKAGSNVAISYVAAGTGSEQSGSANYFDVVISATDTTYSAATQSVAGLMSAADKKKLDGIAEGANKYSLPLAANGTRGGVQIGFTTDAANRNYAVQLSNEKMYVNVPWENTWRGIQNNLTSQSTTDSLSAYQGYLLANGSARDNSKLPLTGGTLTGTLTARDVVVQSAYTLKIGDAILKWDSANNALKLYKLSGSSEVAVNFYATGGVSALGMSEDGSAGAGDVTWALLADGTDTRQIALSHLTTSLTTITGGTTDATNKRYAVYKNSSNQLFVDVPWQAGSGTVTSVKVGSTSYTPTNGVISLPAYPTSLPASDVYSWAKASTKPTYAYSEITGTPTIPAAANNGTFSIKALVGSTTTTISDFTANQSTADDFTLVQGANVTFTLDTTNRKLTIAAKDTTYTLAGLMGSSAKGSATQPIYWNGSAFANTTYTLGKSVPSDAVFTDHYAWSDITNKPSAAGNATTPVYWTGSGFTTCTAYANASVSYATSAGSATSASTATKALYLLTNNTSQAADDCYDGAAGLRFWRYNGTSSTTGQTGGDGWILSWSWNVGSVGGQIYLDDNPSKTICIRGYNSTTKDFTTWATLLHSDNYTAYTVKKDGTGASGSWGISITGNAATATSATTASKLSTVSKTLFGNTYWTSGGVPTSIGVSGSNASLSYVQNISMSGYIKIGDAYLSYDSTNNAIRVSANANGTGAVNFYAVGGVSALGETADGQAGVGDVTWALLADGTDTRQIALSHLTTSLTTITGGTTDATNKRYAVYKNSSNQLFVDVPWQAGSGTVTSVKVGTTSYTPTNGVISLPAYPTVPTKVSQLTNDSGYITSYTNTWRNIYVAGTEKIGSAITTKGLNFAAGSNVSLSFAAAGTGSGQSGNANYGTLTISATDTTYSAATQSAAGLMSAADKKKLDGIAANANNYSLPLAASGTRGGIQIGYTTSGKNYAVQLSSEKAYVNVPWTDTTYSANNGVGLSGTTFYNSGVRATTINGNYLRVNTNGTNADLTIPYATSAGSVAWSNVSSKPTTLSGYGITDGMYSSQVSAEQNNITWAQTQSKSTRRGFIYNTSGAEYSYLFGFTSGTNSSTGYPNYGAVYKFGYTDRYIRVLRVSGGGTWQSTDWEKISAGYADSAGNATTAGGLAVHSGRNNEANKIVRTDGSGYIQCGWINTTSGNFTGTPDRIWASNDAYMRYMTPANFFPTLANDSSQLSVTVGGQNRKLTIAYASSAGNADTVDSEHASAFAHRAAANNLVHSGNEITMIPDSFSGSLWFNYQSVGRNSSSNITEYIFGNGKGGQLAKITSGNFSGNAATATKATNDSDGNAINTTYLKRSGGTMTGTLKLTVGIGIEAADGQGLLVYKPTDWTGISSSQWGIGAAIQGVIRSNDTSLIHYRNSGSYGTAYEIIDSKGGQTINSSLQIGSSNGAYLQIGAIRLVYDSNNNAVKVIKSDGGNANLYATGGVSALGAGQEGGGGGDVTWALLANNSDTRQIAASHLNVLNNYLKGYALDTGNANDQKNFEYISVAEGSGLPSGAQYGSLLVLPYRSLRGNTTPDFGVQLFLPNGDDTSYPNSMFYRTSLSSSWNAWQRVQNVSMSDVRLKTILSNPTFGIEQIANAPIIRYLWSKEGYGDKKVHIGSTAQYWMNVSREFVEEEFGGYYSLQYGVAALVSAITIARKVMTHEEKIALLETRVSALEKENGEQEMLINSLQEELAKYKAA